MKHHMEDLLALLLFGVFAACILSVLLTGADAYRRLTVRDDASCDRRTAAQYLSTKIRQGDRLGGVTVEHLGGEPTLALSEDVEGETYVTWIYVEDGYLRELFSAADAGLERADGEKILPSEAVTFSLEHGVLAAELTAQDGTVQQLRWCLRSGEGAAS